MTLQSILYGLFLISVVGCYWSLPSKPLRLWVVFIASLVFYASLQIQYVPLLIALTALNFYLGVALNTPLDWRIPNEEWQFAQQVWNYRRALLMWLGIVINVLVLLSFKYFSAHLSALFDYFSAYLSPLFNFLGFTEKADPALSNSTGRLTVSGISFFCFECIAYLVDVYRGSPATTRFIEFGAYKLFFPKLISGPITRFHPFKTQFKGQKAPQLSQTVEGLWLIASGAVKKLLIADHLNQFVKLSFDIDNLARAGSSDIWLATFAYGLQIYFDFSGYVDIARGSAIFLGFNLPQNFYFPYFSTNIADFWRRWHMTLGAWLRNYLYFPLGGSRRGLLRTCLNLGVVMLIAGIWHGDNWGFLIWGGLHGLALAAHRLVQTVGDRWPWLDKGWMSLPGVLTAWLLTQGLVFGSWLFFRLPEPKYFTLALQRIWGQAADVQYLEKVYVDSFGLSRPQLMLLLGGFVIAMAMNYGFNQGLKLQLSWPVKLLLIPVCLFLAWLLAPSETPPYIYFEF